LAGSYLWTDRYKISSAEMILNEDSTFRYLSHAGDLFHINANGRWSVSPDNKFLIFKSEILSDNDLIEVVEEKNYNISDSSFKIAVADLNGYPTVAYIKLDPDSSKLNFTASDQVSSSKVYKRKNIKSIALTSLELDPKVLLYELKDKRTNEVSIRFKLVQPKDYRYFKNEKWRVKQNRLFDPDTAFKKNRNIYYKIN